MGDISAGLVGVEVEMLALPLLLQSLDRKGIASISTSTPTKPALMSPIVNHKEDRAVHAGIPPHLPNHPPPTPKH